MTPREVTCLLLAVSLSNSLNGFQRVNSSVSVRGSTTEAQTRESKVRHDEGTYFWVVTTEDRSKPVSE